MSKYCPIAEEITNCTDNCKDCLEEEERKEKPKMYKITLTIYPIADCGEDLSKGEPCEVSYEGSDVHELKKYIDDTILNTIRALNTSDGETFVEMDIEHNGEYYDHDEQTIWVDLQNNCIKYGIEKENTK